MAEIVPKVFNYRQEVAKPRRAYAGRAAAAMHSGENTASAAARAWPAAGAGQVVVAAAEALASLAGRCLILNQKSS